MQHWHLQRIKRKNIQFKYQTKMAVVITFNFQQLNSSHGYSLPFNPLTANVWYNIISRTGLQLPQAKSWETRSKSSVIAFLSWDLHRWKSDHASARLAVPAHNLPIWLICRFSFFEHEAHEGVFMSSIMVIWQLKSLSSEQKKAPEDCPE